MPKLLVGGVVVFILRLRKGCVGVAHTGRPVGTLPCTSEYGPLRFMTRTEAFSFIFFVVVCVCVRDGLWCM